MPAKLPDLHLQLTTAGAALQQNTPYIPKVQQASVVKAACSGTYSVSTVQWTSVMTTSCALQDRHPPVECSHWAGQWSCRLLQDHRGPPLHAVHSYEEP